MMTEFPFLSELFLSLVCETGALRLAGGLIKNILFVWEYKKHT